MARAWNDGGMASERARDNEHEVRPAREVPAVVPPAPADGLAGQLLRMQGTVGNATVLRLLRDSGLLAAPPDPGDVAGRIRDRLGGGEELPGAVRERIAPAVDAPLGEVRVHRDAEAANLAGEVGARAFTTGTDVFFAAGAYAPGTRGGDELLAHELTHTTQPAAVPVATGPLHVTDPGDPSEVAAAAASRRLDAPGSTGPVPAAAAVPVSRATVTVAREPAPASPGIPDQYASLTRPTLSDGDTRMLQQVTGGAQLVELIQERNAIRAQLSQPSPPSADPLDGGVPPGGAPYDTDALRAREQQLTGQIDPQLAQLGIASDTELVDLVQSTFPARFLAEAKQVALDMLTYNRDQANSELARYSEQVCSPDMEGLLAADRALADLDPAPVEISIQVAESALQRYQPSAGVLTPEEFAKLIPPNEQSVMVDIANLDRNRQQLEQRRAIYDNARYGYGRTYPILLDSQYHPGTYASAPPEQLGALVAKPVGEIVANIDRVEKAIKDDELKVWNMNAVLRITQERLQVTHPVLLKSIENRIHSVQQDEAFVGWVVAALAITTSVLAGILFTPAAGAAVAAAWTAGSLAGHVTDALNETAANRVSLDEKVADLSLNEPTIAWILLDALSLGLDLSLVASALRSSARLLVQQADVAALQAFRDRAAATFEPAAADQLATRAAARLGIALTGVVAEDQLAFVARELADLGLSQEALARVVAKGADVNQIKGQILEEIMNTAVTGQLAAGSSPVLGASDTAGLEFIEGFRITDSRNALLTDGMVVRRMPDGSVEIVSVLESKAGPNALKDLYRTSDGPGPIRELVNDAIETDPDVVAGALRRAGFDKDAELAGAGRKGLSDEGYAAAAADKEVRRTVTQTELGGQVRTDIERLVPNERAGPTQILIDGVPTPVRFSPTRTRFVGAVPQDVPTGAATRALQREGFSFQPMPLGVADADLAARAERIAGNATRATAATATSAAPATP
jgi:hypothetical protein